MIPKNNAMLLDVQYMKPNKKNGNTDGCIYIIWKDLRTGEKNLEVINNPKVDLYFTKPEYRTHTYNKSYEELSKCDKKTVPYKDVIKEIVEDAGPEYKKRLHELYQMGRYREIDSFKTYPYVYCADFDIRGFYRYQWLQKYDNDKPKPIKNGFLDIEVDSLEAVGFPDPQFCPIDLVTIINDSTMMSYTFALIGVECKEKDMTNMSEEEKVEELKRREMYKSRIQQQENLVENVDLLQRELHNLFDDLYGEIDYNFYFYKDERKMITHIFELIHKIKVDFMMVWNIGFDIPYFIDRMKALNMNPEDIMCHPDFPYKMCYFKKDTRNFEIKNKTDFFFCTDYTMWRDQMENYAAIRKGREELRRFNLSYIAKMVLKDEKYDYSEDGNIKTLSYNNYWKYVIYNIKDVLLQLGIEKKTKDTNQVYISSYLNATPYESIFKQTVKLRNLQYITYLRDGTVPGENINCMIAEASEDEQDENNEKFEGALVGDPRLMLPVGAKLYGKPQNNIFTACVDMDMSAFYPRSIMAMNIEPSCLIFKCICDPKQFDVMGGHLKFNGITHYSKIGATTSFDLHDVGKEIMDNYQTGNVVNTLTKWCNAPTIEELIEEMETEGTFLS